MDTSALIEQYFPGLTEKQKQQFHGLKEVYSDWNAKINVISRKDMDHFYIHHVLHSLSIAKVLQFRSGSRILDVGTGGGFPGVPLAIMFPDCHFHLVDSIGKKITVVQEVITALGITNVVAEKKRAEELKSQYDFVVSRAVAQWSEIHRWTSKLILKKGQNSLPNGWLLLKGGDLKEEFKAVRKHIVIHDISDKFPEEFFETKKVVYVPAF